MQRAAQQLGYFTQHWNAGHHSGDAGYVERNGEAIAQSIINWSTAQGLADDTKIVVNYNLDGGWQKYFVVVVFYHSQAGPGGAPLRYVNFHSCRRSNVHADAQGEPNAVVYNTNWRNGWQ